MPVNICPRHGFYHGLFCLADPPHVGFLVDTPAS